MGRAFERTLCHLVERWARESPQAIAVWHGGATLSYAALDAEANRIAAVLRRRGAARGVRIGVCLPRGPAWIATLLGVLKTGAAYLPLDPDYPAKRLERLVQQGEPLFVVSRDSPHGDAVANEAVTCADASLAIRADDPCYVVFTSGSTGDPKGVVVSHGNVARLFDDLGPALAAGPADVWSQIHSSAFGFSVFEVWGAFVHGATLAIAPASVRSDALALGRFLADAGVTVLSQTPSVWRETVLTEAFNWPIAAVRALVLSGEAVRGDDLQRWSRQHAARGPRLLNTYAITETGGNVLLREYAPGDVDAADIGRPLHDVTLQVLGADGQPAQPGEEGELWVTSPGVALGYCNDAALTAERFVTRDPGRSYRTGDRVRVRPDGAVEFCGRVDDQVKWRGHRLELGEIESLLRTHPGVAHAAAAIREDAAGEPKLVAYVVPEATPEFWPSLGGYGIYDEFLYELMTSDAVRTDAYRAALERHAPGAVVLDLGTGPHALLARLAVAAGARHVYAVELLADAAAAARAAVEAAGLADRITVIEGDAGSVVLPEPATVCTQGIIGNIGSADGIAAIWNRVRPQLSPGCVPVPARCTTLIAPVELPAALRDSPQFAPLAERYLRRLFAVAGREFDPRLCVRNLPAGQLLAPPQVFEDLDFNTALPEQGWGSGQFTLTRAGRCDGFLLWTVVTTAAGVSIDYLAHQQAWLPVFLPLPVDGPALGAGAVVNARWQWGAADDEICPDYTIVATLPGDAVEYTSVTRHRETARGATPLHRRLLPSTSAPPARVPEELRRWLARHLPEPLLPNAWMVLDALPLSPTGKLDRRALPAPAERTWGGQGGAPRTSLESDLAAIWSEVLGAAALGVQDNFFDLGGDSIAAVRVTTRLQQLLDEGVMLAALFEAPTIAALARYLHEQHPAAIERHYGATRPRGTDMSRSTDARRKHGEL